MFIFDDDSIHAYFWNKMSRFQNKKQTNKQKKKQQWQWRRRWQRRQRRPAISNPVWVAALHTDRGHEEAALLLFSFNYNKFFTEISSWSMRMSVDYAVMGFGTSVQHKDNSFPLPSQSSRVELNRPRMEKERGVIANEIKNMYGIGIKALILVLCVVLVSAYSTRFCVSSAFCKVTPGSDRKCRPSQSRVKAQAKPAQRAFRMGSDLMVSLAQRYNCHQAFHKQVVVGGARLDSLLL